MRALTGCGLSHTASLILYAAQAIRGHYRGTGKTGWGHQMLTDRACRQAKGLEKPYKLGDAHGLYLFVLPSGYKSWRWKYRIGGKEKRVVFGGYPCGSC